MEKLIAKIKSFKMPKIKKNRKAAAAAKNKNLGNRTFNKQLSIKSVGGGSETEINNREQICLKELYKLADEDESVAHLRRFSDDDLALMVIRAYDCNANHAWRVLKSLQLCATDKYPELFRKVDPDYLQHVFDMKCFQILKRKEDTGPGVLVFRLNRWDHKKASPDDLVAAGILYAYRMAKDSPQVQREGIVTLLDIDGFQFSHAKHVTFDLTTKIQHCLSYATPVKLVAYIVINPRPVFERVYDMMKHLIPESTRRNVYVSKSDFAILHEIISKDKLPQSLGGDVEEEFGWRDDIEQIISKDLHFKKVIKSLQEQMIEITRL